MADYVEAGELTRRIRAYAFGGQAPDVIEDDLQTIPGVAADVICQAGELLYAHFDLLEEPGRTLTAEIYQHAVQQGWSGFNQGERSAAIVAAIDAMVNDGSEDFAGWPEPRIALRGGHDWRHGSERAAG